MTDTFAMAELLRGDYKAKFEQIALYADMSGLNEQFLDDRIMNIYDLLTEAQEKELPVEKIVGSDLEKFCKDYFNYEEKSQWTRDILKRLYHVSLIMLVFSVIDIFMLEGTVPLKNATVSIKPIFSGALTACVILVFEYFVRHKLMFRNSKIKPITYYIIFLVVFIAGVAGFSTCFKGLDVSISVFWVIGVFGGYCALYLVVTWIGRYHRYGTIQNPNKPSKEERAEKKAFQQELTLQSDMVSCSRDMAKRYQKLKKKNEKKGKPEYTMEDYASLVKKEPHFGIGFKFVCIGMPVICGVWQVVKIVRDENILMAIVFCGIYGGLMFFLWRAVWKACKAVFYAQRAIIHECEENGFDIMEYVARQENQ